MIRNLFCTIILFACLFTAQFAGAANNSLPNISSDNLSFGAQCPILLKQADEFAKDCMAHAQEQVRNFHPSLLSGGFSGEGQPESHRAYFMPARPGSHFSLGCTLNGKPSEMAFLGIYYSTKDTNFKAADTAPIRYIDFRGNVGVWIGDQPVNLLAIRQFDTPEHPLTNWKKDRIKNCQSATDSNGTIHDFNDDFGVFEKKYPNKLMIKACMADQKDSYDGCLNNEYVDFFPTDDHRYIYTHDLIFYWFVTSGGDLIVRKDVVDQSCTPAHGKMNVPNIAEEVCN